MERTRLAGGWAASGQGVPGAGERGRGLTRGGLPSSETRGTPLGQGLARGGRFWQPCRSETHRAGFRERKFSAPRRKRATLSITACGKGTQKAGVQG